MASLFEKPSVLIVGAGELGASAAVKLLRSGHYSTITVLDRAATLPALDAASTDINKVVRFDYTDADYAKLAREAVERWQAPEWAGIYHPTGLVLRGLAHHNAATTFENAKALEPGVRLLSTPDEVRDALSPSGGGVIGDKALAAKSYLNPSGGWVHASAAINVLYNEIRARGGEIVPGAELESLVVKDRDVRGVRCADGRVFEADKTIVAMGSWTGGHPGLKDIFPPGLLVPTGQTVAAVQLSEEEQERYKDMRTVANLDGSGYYSFPPNADGLVKFALHAGGYTLPTAIPRTAADADAVAYTESNGVGWIPKQSFAVMRDKFGEIYPELAKKPMAYTRMCWYSDTPDSDFVIDYAPGYRSLLVASGGAGHAFKFLPVMGELIAARLEGRLPPHLARKWRIDRPVPASDDDRQGLTRRPLVLAELVTAEDMGPLTKAKL